MIRVPAANDAAENRPVVLGHGKGLFRVGELLAKDDFENLEHWVVQIQDRADAQPAHVESRNNSMDCFLPGRGCTVWFKRKLKTRVTITYDVLCPTNSSAVEGLLPRDINNFWMATDPVDRDDGLFDSKSYDGNFSSYDKMHGYYASSGGRKNQTTRMRRYPRVVQGEPIEHIALNDKDEKPGSLITPNQAMSIQLVAFDDVIQYIVDGKLVYEMRRGERIQIEARERDGRTVMRSG